MNITLIGLDTLGISMGLALKAATGEIPIVGHDPEPRRAKRAQELKAVDHTHWNLLSACQEADLVVLSLPLDELERTLRVLGPELPAGTVLLDTHPAKRRVMALAAELLPPHITLIGGHPLALRGSAQAQPAAELLQGATFYLIASPQAPSQALDLAATFVEALGARPHFCDADEHDGIVAAALYAPALGALAALQAIQQPEGAAEQIQASGPTLAALAELCAPAGEAAALQAQAEALAPRLEALIRTLEGLRAQLIRGDFTALARVATSASETAQEWLERHNQPVEADAATREGAFTWRQLLLGGRRTRKR